MATSSGLAPVISSTGIAAGTFAQWFAFFVSQYLAIYGADSFLGNDSQDGQFIGVMAQACADNCASVIASYNNQSPATAQGTGLSSTVKINGLKRNGATFSTAPVTALGIANTTITNGSVADSDGNVWALPSNVTIGSNGSVVVTGTTITGGPVSAAVGTASIQTPVFGWQSATIAANLTTGIAQESDAALRVRQSNSTAAPSITIFDGILGAVEAVAGVTRAFGYENNTNAANANGIPAGNSAFIVEGGAQADILNALALRAPPGMPFFGTTSATVIDAKGASKIVAYSVCTETVISVLLTLPELAGFNAQVQQAIQQSILAYITTLPIGTAVGFFELLVPALAPLTQAIEIPATATEPATTLGPFPGSYKLTAMTVNGGTSDIAIAFNAAATTTAADITFAT